MNLIIFILASAGLTWMLTRSKLFKPLREKITIKRQVLSISVKAIETKGFSTTIKHKFYWVLDELLGCYGCTGAWMGAIIYLLQKCNAEIIIYICIASITSQILVLLVQFLEKK